MEINIGVGNLGLSEHQWKFSKIYESIDMDKYCGENMTELFNEQIPRVENKKNKEITSEEGKDGIITGLLRYNFEQNLTRRDEDLVDILVDLGKKNSVLNIDINKGLNVSDVADKFPKVVKPETN